MSLITRCPACQTLFKVVPDQLRVSGGWVRCGMCDEIFDAASHAQPDPPPQPEPAVVQVQGMAAAMPGRLPDVQISSMAVESRPLDGLALADIKAETAETAPVTDIELPDIDELAEQNKVEAVLKPVPMPVAVPVPVSVNVDVGVVNSLAETETSTESPLPTSDPVVSFMKAGMGRSIWQKTGIRVALGFVTAGLLFGLGLQAVIYERDRIAASMSQLRPVLGILCASLDCAISPFKQIGSIVIESSAFTRIRGDVYRLNFAVKNTSSIELAMPALELTLTDAQDQAVMRRVFMPLDLSAPSNVMAPDSDWTGAVSVVVRPGAASGTERIAGYRVLAFYP